MLLSPQSPLVEHKTDAEALAFVLRAWMSPRAVDVVVVVAGIPATAAAFAPATWVPGCAVPVAFPVLVEL